MTEEEQALIDSLQYEEVTKTDKDGNVVVVKEYSGEIMREEIEERDAI